MENDRDNPNVKAQITPLSGAVLKGDSVTFDGSNSYGAIDTYHWDFGDGSTATGKQVNKSFSKTGIYQVILKVSNSKKNNSCAALVRVHSPDTIKVPQLLLDTDAKNEVDDQHYISYALFSELDVLGINSIHHARWQNNETELSNAGSETTNYNEILKILDLAKKSGLPKAQVPEVFRGATEPLKGLKVNSWDDTKTIVTEASRAIIAAARGASPDNPVWVLPVGPATNIASALLQVRREGWEMEFRRRIRVCWLGGGPKSAHKETFNGGNDPWAVYVTYKSGIEFLVLLEQPTGASLKMDKTVESHLYPDNPLGDYLKKITPDKPKALFDVATVAMVIGNYLGKNWLTKVEPSILLDRDQNYRWETTSAPINMRIIRSIDHEAMKEDFFNTLNGRPTKLV